MRLFVGIPIPENVREKCSAFQKALPRNLKFVIPEQFHFTLKFLGEQRDASAIIAALDKITQKRFDVEVCGVGAFPNVSRPAVVWVGGKSKDFITFTEKVQKTLDKFRKEEHKSVVPHLTVARVSERVNIEQILVKWKNVSFGRFVVSSFILYESVLTSKGSVYKVVKEFELKPPGCVA